LRASKKIKPENIKSRYSKIESLHNEYVAKKTEVMNLSRADTPISTSWVAACLNKVKSDNSIVVSELGLNVGHIDYAVPGSIVSGAQAGGLGFGLGAALGAKLAEPERDVILFVGDGSYMFGNPTPAHFVAKAQNLATLTVVMNNAQWFAVNRSTRNMYPNGEAVKTNEMPITSLAPSPNYEMIMEACGGYGEMVDDPNRLEAAMQEALEKVRGGTSCLLNVITMAGGRD